MSTVAVIPARGGSKRIPGKNLKPFAGKPMLQWSIDAARDSGLFDRIAVSTDDEAIAAAARDGGAEVPFTRPAELSDDHAGLVPVMRHALDALQAADGDPACCILATAPFVRAEDLREGHRLMLETGAPFVVPVTTFPFPVQRALRIDGEGRLEPVHPEHVEARSQDLEERVHDTGQFYWGRAGAWRAEAHPVTAQAAPLRLPRHRVQDIDTPEDWERAERLFQGAGGE